MTISRVLRGVLVTGILAATAFALDTESDAWAAAMALETKAAAELAQPSRFAEAHAAFEAFAKAYPASPHVEEARIEAAWTSAMDLKMRARYPEAASAFEAFAKTYPSSSHASEAFVEAGVAWFVLGKNAQVLHRNTPDSIRNFKTALEKFDKVAGAKTEDPSVPRAQFMVGSTHFLMGDLGAAEKDFSVVIDKFQSDKKYYGKSLERRAAARRQMLKNDLALEDLQRHRRELGDRGEDAEIVKRYLGYATMFGKPAPALDVESWVQGEPTSLEELRGEVVVLYSFATWCPNCAKERTHVLDVVARFEPMGVKFIGVITHSQGTTAEIARPFLAANQYNFPVIMDRGTTVGRYLSTKIPDMVLIDRSGKVRWHDHPSNFQDSTLEALINGDVATADSTTSPPAKTH